MLAAGHLNYASNSTRLIPCVLIDYNTAYESVE